MERRYYALKWFRKFVYFFSRNSRKIKKLDDEIQEINKRILKIFAELNNEDRRDR